MSISDIVSEIDAEISVLQRARALLVEPTPSGAKRGRPPGSRNAKAKSRPVARTPIGKDEPGRGMTIQTRARMSAAQKKRWAKIRRAAKKSARITAPDGTGV